METLCYEDVKSSKLIAGFPGEGNLVVSILFDMDETGQVKETKTEISGDYQNSSYNFYTATKKTILPIRISSSHEEIIQLPDSIKQAKQGMSDESKLDMYLKLKADLEKEGLI
ncbi:MAG: hypothetical protein HLUCCX10_03195 [Algoriphagus marincola HL-49]|uniref:Uncharacterized protein n=1 Tax=Algoriphagus marincola HL-49 TaxID=1305737 RepID=A0A0P7YEG5_9BACT|nr:MAG: hypothetical protein HLUCCX10_03195 [Algoriphagus marincola HL-49]